jgi:hypothetical membrane protein
MLNPFLSNLTVINGMLLCIHNLRYKSGYIMTTYFAYCGLIASIWIVFGVFLAAKFYPNYNHNKQFCSELGAKGSPTERLSPIINNYPLGILFCFFCFAVIQMKDSSIVSVITGSLIIIHGIGTWVAGYFPMDANAYTKSPSFNCKVHSWAGFIMLLALLIAQLLMVFSPINQSITTPFKIFSIASILATVYFIYKMAKTIKNKTNPALYQRLSYGAQLVWLSGLSLVLTQ